MELKKIIIAGVVLAMAQTTGAQLSAFCCNGDIDGIVEISGGYRWDRLSVHENFFDPATDLLDVTADHTLKNLHVWELGAKGRIEYCNWYARGYIYGGWADHGKWHLDEDNFGLLNESRGKVHKGHTLNATVGVGYLFTWDDCACNQWGIGPVVGWSYDRIRYKVKNVFTNDEPDSILEGVSFRQTWEGPWLGVDLAYKSCQIIAHAGYEYHWSRWHNRQNFSDPETLDNHFKSNHAHGNLFYLDAKWLFSYDCCTCTGWSVGLGLKYQDWKVKKGHQTNDEEFDGRIGHAEWCSGEITLDLGYAF